MDSLPDTMMRIAIREPGGPEVLVPERGPLPSLDRGVVLIRVAAAGVNRPDVMQREGAYPPPKGASPIPGLEVAGTVAAVGEGATRFRPGDRVMALVPGGGYAEYCAAAEPNVLPIPDGVSFEQAGAIPETFFTVWSNVFERGALASGEWFLVHGGSSGIGTTAIQLAKTFGAKVLATAGSDDKCAACTRLGADVAINYRTQDFVSAVKQATGGAGANLILDMVGGSYVDRNYVAAAVEGRIVQIAALEGIAEKVDVRRLMVKRLVHTGSTLRARDVGFKAQVARALEAKVWPLLAAGTVAPVIDRSYKLTEAADAHRRMDSGDHIGKLVLLTGAG